MTHQVLNPTKRVSESIVIGGANLIQLTLSMFVGSVPQLSVTTMLILKF